MALNATGPGRCIISYMSNHTNADDDDTPCKEKSSPPSAPTRRIVPPSEGGGDGDGDGEGGCGGGDRSNGPESREKIGERRVYTRVFKILGIPDSDR